MTNELFFQKAWDEWVAFVDFDEEQTSFNVGSWNYTFHKYTKMLKTFIEEYNCPANFALIYMKNLFIWYLNNAKISLYDVITEVPELAKVRNMHKMLTNDVIDNAEKEVFDFFYEIINLLFKDDKLIGEIKTDFSKLLEDSIDIIFEELPKANIEVYVKGGQLNPITYICDTICVYDTLADCLLDLQQGNEGFYVCYITNHETCDGYFGFFIVNNRNIFSINERINEAFRGQHATGRNNRFVEGKLDGLFPYELFKYSDYDYKGYATTYEFINNEKVSIKDLSTNKMFVLLMTICFIKFKFEYTKLDDYKLIYTSYLLNSNIKSRLNESDIKNDNVLVAINNKSNVLIETVNEKLNFNWTTDDILNNSYKEEFSRKHHPEKSYYEVGWFEDTYTKIFVEEYADGFELDNSKILFDSSIKFLSSDDNYIRPYAEFVSSYEQMKMQAYMDSRQQLADYIKGQIDKEYERFEQEYSEKNSETSKYYRISAGAHRWFNDILVKNKDDIIRTTVQFYVDQLNNKSSMFNDIKIQIAEGKYYEVRASCYPFDNVGWHDEQIDEINGKKKNIWICVEPQNYKALQCLINDDLPKIIKGWVRHPWYNGNNNLDVVDPVSRIETPFSTFGSFSWAKHSYNFSYAIGFSKSGLKKYIKDNNIVPIITKNIKKEDVDIWERDF